MMPRERIGFAARPVEVIKHIFNGPFPIAAAKAYSISLSVDLGVSGQVISVDAPKFPTRPQTSLT